METIGNATYSPDDNKIRIYPDARLEPEIFKRVKDAGFKWAPKQELFFAPAWTPAREDLALELCGEIGDEDKTLAERQEERAERFEGYSDKREKEAGQARDAVKRIADYIPFGQPILVGHHSEKRARRDAQKIENGMRAACRLWETSEYWTHRAAAAIRHAKYKERPDVRARRIKKLEAERRKQQKSHDRSEALIKTWRAPLESVKRKDGEPVTLREAVLFIANYRDGGYFKWKHTHASGYIGPISLWEAAGGNIDGKDPETVAIATPEEIQAAAIRNHENNIKHARRWLTHYDGRLSYERAMMEEAGGTAADRTKPTPGAGVKCWASPRGGFSYVQKVNRVSVTIKREPWQPGGRVFSQTMPFDKIGAVITPEEIKAARDAGRLWETENKTGFFIAKEKEPAPEPKPQPEKKPAAEDFEKMQETLKAGIETVTAPQLFITPPDLARRMRLEADIWPGETILEPSAGTGAILEALPDTNPMTAVEIDSRLAARLEEADRHFLTVHNADFLTLNGELGTFNKIVMNPPFKDAADIKHIKHALEHLKPGGRLVAICANGPRQQKELKPLAEDSGGYYEPLPDGTFKNAGTMVRAALLVIEG